jgi:hypothetical protein
MAWARHRAKALRAVLALAVVAACGLRPTPVGAAEAPPAVIPWPESLKPAGGDMKLAGGSKIVFTDAALAPLARLLGDEIHLATAVPLTAAREPAAAGDIALAVDPQLKGEAYAISVTDKAVVRGGNYRAVAWATATLLQAIGPAAAGGGLRLAKMTVEDKPVAAYRGLLIDVARQWHPVETLRPLIEMCRLYKINYVQLHLNDQQSFTFPSKAFPTLATVEKGKRRTYTLEEITGLVRYADERGVTLVPEMEGPGHHSGALRSLWGRKGASCMDIGNEKTYEGMEVLVGELCEVFASSPYIHIGADECSLGGLGESDEEKAFMARHGLQGTGGLYNYYIVRMNEIIKKHGKQTICWEGHPRHAVRVDLQPRQQPRGARLHGHQHRLETAVRRGQQEVAGPVHLRELEPVAVGAPHQRQVPHPVEENGPGSGRPDVCLGAGGGRRTAEHARAHSRNERAHLEPRGRPDVRRLRRAGRKDRPAPRPLAGAGGHPGRGPGREGAPGLPVLLGPDYGETFLPADRDDPLYDRRLGPRR